MTQISKNYSLCIRDLTYIQKHSFFLSEKLLTIMEDGEDVFREMLAAGSGWLMSWIGCHKIKK